MENVKEKLGDMEERMKKSNIQINSFSRQWDNGEDLKKSHKILELIKYKNPEI